MKTLLTVLICLAAINKGMQAQNSQDTASIKSLCGCFEVEFKYTETFSTDKDYQYKDPYHARALEWAGLVEQSANKMVIQHILVIDDSMIVKHWREDWTYQLTDLLQYRKDHQWKKIQLQPEAVAGQWTQSVWEVNDAPRYQGTAVWVHQNGEHFWRSVADAPLPRREYTKRNDYNVMTRGNTLQLTDSGYVHEQDNTKTVREDGRTDRIIVREKGYNIYRKVDDHRCFAAADWWAKNSNYWHTVRKNWDDLIAHKKVITVNAHNRGNSLSQKLEDLETLALHQPGQPLGDRIRKVLEEFVK